MRRHRLRRAALLAALIGLFAAAIPAVAGSLDEAVVIDLRAQPLGDALRELAKQSGLQMLFDPVLVAGRQAPAIKATLAPRRALQRLLQGTGLRAQEEGPGVLVIRPEPSDETSTPPAPASKTVSDAGSTVGEPRALDEVVVTAQKRTERLQDVPMAITVLNAELLHDRGISTFDGIAHETPSMSFAPFPNSSNTLVLFMRGQGNLNPANPAADSAVGLYEDGFYIGRPQATTFDLADIERVEVLRGPQGTLYGRNTTGGAVNIISKKPTGEFGLKQTLELGNRDRFRSVTSVNLPAWHGLSLKGTFLESSVDGYVRNLREDSHDYGEESQQAGRVQVHWEATDRLQLDYFFTDGVIDSTPIYYQRPAQNGATIHPGIPYFADSSPMRASYRPIELRASEAKFDAYGLTLTWEATDDLTLKSLTGYRALDTYAFQDYAEAFAVRLAQSERITSDEFAQELQALGTARDQHLNYVLGLYYFKETPMNDQAHSFPGFNLTQFRRTFAESRSVAAFAQLDWRPEALADRLELSIGGRFTRDERSAERFARNNNLVLENGSSPTSVAPLGASTELSFDRFAPSFSANYQWTDLVRTYAKVSTGYRAGGAYHAAPPGRFRQTFLPEEIISYELGLKSELLAGRMRFNAAFFYNDFKDVQINVPFDPANISQFQVYNVGKAEVAGAEVEVAVQPTPKLFLSANYAYVDFSYKSIDVVPGSIFDAAANPLSPYRVGDDISDLFAPNFTPQNSFALAADHTFFHGTSVEISARADYRWEGERFFAVGSGPAVPNRDLGRMSSRGLLDLRLTAAWDDLKLSLWGKNVLDRDHSQSEVAVGGAQVAVRSPLTGAVTPAGLRPPAIAWAEPPTYGVTLVYEY